MIEKAEEECSSLISEAMENMDEILDAGASSDTGLRITEELSRQKQNLENGYSDTEQADISNPDKTAGSEIRERMVLEYVRKWMLQLPAEYSALFFDAMNAVWGYEEVLCAMAEGFWYERGMVSEKVSNISFFQTPVKKKNQKMTIAAYYRNIKNGGAQRVVANLCNIWASLKDENGDPRYNVILITNEEPDDQTDIPEFPLNPSVTRVCLPDRELYIKRKYRTIYDIWYKIIDTYQIDVIIDSLWIAPYTLWDLLCIKGHPRRPAFLMHCHSFTCLPYKFIGSDAKSLLYEYQLSDGVVVLSECDKTLVSRFTGHCRQIINPMTFAADHSDFDRREPHSIVWTARISEEKQPLDLIYMTDRVVKEIPDVKLYIVGDGSDKLLAQMQDMIANRGLEHNIILTGFSDNVAEYYKKTSIMVVTSEFEGYPLVIGEAMAYGLPVISYDLPWVSFIADGRGILTVEQNRPDLMATEVIRLLSDSSLREQLSRDAYAHIEDLSAIDIGKEWSDLITDVLEHQDALPVKQDALSILMKYSTRFQDAAKTELKSNMNLMRQKLQNSYREKSRLNEKLQQTYSEKSKLNQKLQQTYAEKSEINRKLQQTYAEKSEINRKLQQTYAEKSEITRKKEEQEKRIQQLEKELQQTKQQYDDLVSSRTYQTALKVKKIIHPFQDKKS